ncbi:MAG TPA: glycoside hydrolase family 6 protein [Yinghuangia sp.]|nr:glycoside hydrolase family 6 protein [Yinghuangia sp.]
MRTHRSLRERRALLAGGLAVVLLGGGVTAQATVGGGLSAHFAGDGDGGSKDKGDLLHNGDFESGTDFWWASGQATEKTVSGAGIGSGKALSVQAPAGEQPWDHMVGQTGFGLKKGKPYVLRFTARASEPVTIRVTVQLETAPYTTALDGYVPLKKEGTEVALPFTATQDIKKAALTFQLGGAKAPVTVVLDDVSAKPGGTASKDSKRPTTPSASPSDTGREADEPEETPTTAPSASASSSTSPKPAPAPPTTAPDTSEPAAGNPLAGTSGLYVDSDSNSANWVAANADDPRAARIKTAIADKPGARWFGGWNTDIRADVEAYVGRAAKADKMPVLVPYNIPGRDCGSYSAGGAATDAAYLTWIGQFAQGIGDERAIVIVEPDAVAQIDCQPNAAAQDARLALIRGAVQRVKAAAPNAYIYIDAGNATWKDAGTMADRLVKAGLGDARGFAVNVSNDLATAQSADYADAVNAALKADGGKAVPYIVDTSRNGNGDANPGAGEASWCNPVGRKLGQTGGVGSGGPELVLWIKAPGDSDGTCGIGPDIPAGQFDPALAIRLIDGT